MDSILVEVDPVGEGKHSFHAVLSSEGQFFGPLRLMPDCTISLVQTLFPLVCWTPFSYCMHHSKTHDLENRDFLGQR